MKIGFIGLGLMGESMALNILTKLKCNLYVYDISEEKIDQLCQEGAIRTSSLIELVNKADIVITMLPNSQNVVDVYNVIYPFVRKGHLFIDMSTINPNVSKELSKQITSFGGSMIDAPVVKSKNAAITGTLGIYVGGKEADYQRAKPILETMGNNIIHLGDNGVGATMKLAHNMLVGSIQNGVNEVLVLAEKANINIDYFIKAISYGGGQNFYLDSKGNSIIEGDYTTAFSVKNMHKDMHLAKDLANQYNLNLSTLNQVVDIYDQAMTDGYSNEDFSATYKVIKNRSINK